MHDILRILGDLTRNRSSSKLKGAETAVRRHGIRLKWPPLRTHIYALNEYQLKNKITLKMTKTYTGATARRKDNGTRRF